MNALVLLVLLILAGCSSTPAPAPVCQDPHADAVAFDAALLRQMGEDTAAVCSRAGEIPTCLTPDDSCDVCQPLRCCAELEAVFVRNEPHELLDACIAKECPVCSE